MVSLRQLLFAAVALIATFLVFTILSLGTLWRSVIPAIMGPVLHSLALLLLVPGSQLLTQPAGKSRFLYACTSALLVIIGLLLAMVKFSISPVRSGIYALIVIPVVLVAVVVSLMATHISNRAGKPLRLTLGFLLITLAWIVPGFLLEYFSVGE